jgi:hypothetical protein
MNNELNSKLPKDKKLIIYWTLAIISILWGGYWVFKKVTKKNYLLNRIDVVQKNRVHGISSWNKGFFSKINLIIAFLKRALIFYLKVFRQ